MNRIILVVDIETTGFLNQGGLIVEIGIVKLDLDTGSIIPAYNSLIKESGFNISHTKGQLGWIFKNSDLTFDEVNLAPDLESQRNTIQDLFNQFQATAFNKAFDFDYLKNRGFHIEELPCPMLIATPIVNLPSANGYRTPKWPTVEETWKHFFGKTNYREAHRGLDDAKHEANIVYELYKMGKFEVQFKNTIEIESQTFFSTKDDIQSVILSKLGKAKQEIKVAVAWFTDRKLFQKLKEKQKNGVKVSLIIANHDINFTCGINFQELAQLGGELIVMGNGEGLMHNKFCIIDFDIVCMGSFNWTISANTRNQEFLNVTSGNQKMVTEFVDEFERLRELCGKETKLDVPDLSEVFQIFNLIKAFINLNQPNQITPYIYKLQGVTEVADIKKELEKQDYHKALQLINQFIHNYSRPVSLTQRKLHEIRFKIQYIAYQVEVLETEKMQMESDLEQFMHRYVIELNPIILKILELKKKLYLKLMKYGIHDSTYEELEEEFRQKNEEFQKEVKVKIIDLNNDELKTIKQMHREGVSLCHPDSPHCIYEDKGEANRMFDQLTKAYKTNDIEKVRYLVGEMRLGKSANDDDNYDEIDYLKAKLVSLEQKYKILLSEILEIKTSDNYKKMPVREKWDIYFEEAKEQLALEYEQLNEKYTHSKINQS